MKLTSGISGSGSGAVVISASADSTTRSGTVSIASKTFSATQGAGACGALDVTSKVSVYRAGVLLGRVRRNFFSVLHPSDECLLIGYQRTAQCSPCRNAEWSALSRRSISRGNTTDYQVFFSARRLLTVHVWGLAARAKRWISVSVGQTEFGRANQLPGQSTGRNPVTLRMNKTQASPNDSSTKS